MKRFTWLTFVVGVAAALSSIGCGPSPKSKGTTPGDSRRTPPDKGQTVWQKLADADPAVRRSAVAEVAKLSSPRALQALVVTLKDADAGVRTAAEEALVQQPAASSYLVAELKGAPAEYVQRIEALILKLGKPAVGALIRAMGEADPMGSRAALVVAKMGNERIRILTHVMTRGSDQAKLRAVKLLASLGTRESKLALVPALATWRQDVRDAARSVLKPMFSDAEVTTRILAMFSNLDFWGSYGLALSVYDHPDPRVHNEIVYGFHTAHRTYSRHALFSSLVKRDPAWYKRIATGVAHPSTRAREQIIKALWFEVSSLQRIQSAAKQYRDTPLLAWATKELGLIKGALKDKTAQKTLMGLTKTLKPYLTYRATFLMKFGGGKANVNKVHKTYLDGLNKMIAKDPEKVGVDTIVAAYVALGDDAWRRSCPIPGVVGLCLQIQFQKTRNGVERRVRFRKRNAKLVKLAKHHLDKAWQFWADGAMLDRIPKSDTRYKARRLRARHYAAWAKFMRAEFQLEEFLQLKLPKGLFLDPKHKKYAASSAKLKAWLADKVKVAGTLVQAYMNVATQVSVSQRGYQRASVYWALGAISRTGVIFEGLSDALLALPMPGNLRTFAAKDAYRTNMAKAAGSLIEQAANSYELCLDSVRKARWHWEWALACESGLARTDSGRFTAYMKKTRYTRAPLPSAGAPHLRGVELVVHGARAALLRCGQKANVGYQYQVTLASQGTITKAVSRGKKPAKAAGACIVKTLQGLTVAPFPGKAATLTVTIP
ncbi:MAG: hypothetical protein ABI333_10740 [bacterium]